MKLYTMKCVYDPETASNPFSPGICGQEKYFVKLETRAEQEAYDETTGAPMCSSKTIAWWNGYMCHALQEDLDDSTIYYYLRFNEQDVGVGGTYEDADSSVWKRIR